VKGARERPDDHINDFPTREAVAELRLPFQAYYESIAKPFQWNFTRNALNALLAKADTKLHLSLPRAA
jgi:hypothetical protein